MSNLISEINELKKIHKFNLKIISKFETEELYDKLKSKFGFEFDKLFIWQLASNFNDTEYETEEWKEIWCNNLNGFSNKIYFCVTNESYYSWKIFYGTKKDILKLICELPFFEYFIFDNKMESVIFDTHHNFFRIVFERK